MHFFNNIQYKISFGLIMSIKYIQTMNTLKQSTTRLNIESIEKDQLNEFQSIRHWLIVPI